MSKVKVDQPTAAPTNKVVSGTVWGAIAAILSWLDDEFWGDRVPGAVEVAGIILAFAIAGYITKNSANQAPPARGIPEGH